MYPSDSTPAQYTTDPSSSSRAYNDTFHSDYAVSVSGIQLALPWVRSEVIGPDSLVQATDNFTHFGNFNWNLQLKCGDFVAIYDDGRPVDYIEFKTERKNRWGNLFIEEISNANTGRDGWYYNLKYCDLLVYVFLEPASLYILDWQKFVPWYDRHRLSYTLKDARSEDNLKNPTKGRPVPTRHIPNDILLGVHFFDDGGVV